MNSAAVGPSLVPGVYYHDLRTAIDWLIAVLGFRVVNSYNGPDGKVVFAELAWGRGMIFASTIPTDGPWAQVGKICICLVADSAEAVKACHQVAVNADAQFLRPLRRSCSPAFPDGVIGFDLEDPEGNLWTVSEYQPADR